MSPASLTIAQAATLTGYKTSGGYFRVALRQLAGDPRVVIDGDRIAAAAVDDDDDGLDRADALALWTRVLPAPAGRMIGALLDGPLAPDALGEVVGLNPRGGFYRAGLRALRDAGVVVEANDVIALATPVPGESR